MSISNHGGFIVISHPLASFPPPLQPESIADFCCLHVQGRKNHCVAVIGDGAITGGMAYEAMNHAGFLDKNMIVILNDNQQVSLPTQYNDQQQAPVGALSGALGRIQANRPLRELREIAKGVTKQLPEAFQVHLQLLQMTVDDKFSLLRAVCNVVMMDFPKAVSISSLAQYMTVLLGSDQLHKHGSVPQMSDGLWLHTSVE